MSQAHVREVKSVILCVDDEEVPLRLRKSVLEKYGFEVVAAPSAVDALGVLEQRPVDLVLTDLLMPGISGTELARKIKRRWPLLPVVLYSGVNEIPDDATCTDLFLSKIEGPAVMCQKIQEILSRPRASTA
jgi:CheY-like chemotaxis protein